MDVNVILQMLVSKFPSMGLVLMALGALVVLGQAYVVVSPSQNDDAFLAKLEAMPIIGALLNALKSFAPIQKK